MTYPKFEEIWKNKFQNAQENPSEAVWEVIAWQIGYKERQRKKWIAWWAAALIAFFLGDGRLVYNFYGKLWGGDWQKDDIAEIVSQANQENIKKNDFLVKKKKQGKQKTSQISTPQINYQEQKNLFTAEAAYELAQEKIASKRPQEAIEEEAVGKPKKRAWWLKTYANAQNVQMQYTYTPQLPIASRMMPNLQSVQKEKNLQKEIASFRHIFTWGAGVELGWQFHRNFYLSSGLHWQRSLFSFEGNSSTPELADYWGKLPEKQPNFNINQYSSVVETAIPEENTLSMLNEQPTISPTHRFTQKMELLTMPIKLGYQRVGHLWIYGAAVGVENSFLLSNTFHSAEENFGEVHQQANRLQTAALAEVSVGLKLNHKTNLHFSPFFKQFLGSSIAPNPSLRVSNTSFGIGFGLQIGL